MSDSLAQMIAAAGTSAEGMLVAKATLLAAAGLAAVGLAPRARAATRHLALAITCAGLLALPVVATLVPTIAVEIPISATALDTREAAPVGVPPVPALERAAGPAAQAAPAIDRLSRAPSIRGIWLAGSLLLLAWLAVAYGRFLRLRRRGLPWPAGHDLLRQLQHAAGMQRQVDLVLHEAFPAPATCGILRPAIILPCDAPGWPAAELRRALVHELEHVRRGDWGVHLLGRAASAVFWFHPLVWMIWSRLQLEAERACDDAVLGSEEAADYADQLVQLARRMSNPASVPTLAMAQRSDLAARVTAILDRTQPRGRVGLLPAAAGVTLAAVLVGGLGPVHAVAVAADRGREADADRGREADTGGAAQESRWKVRALDTGLLEAGERGHLDAINELISAGANVNGVVPGDGTPLIAAARAGRLAAVTLLIDHGADPNLGSPGDGNPIIMAAAEGHRDIVELLLARGARVDDVVPGDENALIQAAGGGHLDVVQMLVERGADINARVWADGFGSSGGEWRTPLNQAQRAGHRAVVDYLLSAGARP